MLGKMYDAFVAYYLKDRQYKNTEREFAKESAATAGGPSQPAASKKPESVSKAPPKEISTYDYLKNISGAGKLFTGDQPEHFAATFQQLKDFIEQSLEEFKVFDFLFLVLSAHEKTQHFIGRYGCSAVSCFRLHVLVYANGGLLERSKRVYAKVSG